MRISKGKLALLVVMSAFGLWSSGTVVVIYYFLKESLPLCPTTTGSISINCNLVLGSSYSQIFGIPLELLAVAYFIVNLTLVYFVAFGKQRTFELSVDILFVWRFIGIVIVPYLVFVELFILKAICLYCTIMHVAIVADFVIISYLLFIKDGGLFGAGQSLDSASQNLEKSLN
jgi:uncharacterized membrane protein